LKWGFLPKAAISPRLPKHPLKLADTLTINGQIKSCKQPFDFSTYWQNIALNLPSGKCKKTI
jgi:hypothetical protein